MAGKAQRKFVATGEEWRELLPAGQASPDVGDPAAEQGPPAVGNEQPHPQGQADPHSEELPDRGNLAPGAHPAQGTSGPGFLQRLKTRFTDVSMRLADELSPASIERKKFAFGTSLADSATLGAMDEGVGAVKAGIEAAKRAVGLGTPAPGTIGDVYRRERDEVRGLTKKAAEMEPAAALAGTAASMAVGAPAAALTAPGKVRAALGVAEGLTTALMSSEAELTGERKKILQALKDTGWGLLTAPLSIAAGTAKTGKAAERAFGKQVSQDIGEGATALAQRRAIPNEDVATMVVDLLEKPQNKALKAAIRGDKQELVQKADAVVKDLAVQTAPIYQQFDEIAGQVPARDIVKHVSDEVGELAQQTNTGALRDALEAVRQDIVDVTKARAAARGDTSPQFGGRPNWTHREVRDWVTELLLREQKTMGSLSETERAHIVNALHDSADTFLRNRMETAAAANPQLQQAWDTLKPLNRDISAAIRIRDLAEHVDNREFQARGKLGERVAKVAQGTMAGAGALLAGSGDLGLTGGLAGFAAGAAALPAARGLTRLQTEALGRMARRARAGSPLDQLAQEAIEAGVPQRVVRALQVSLEQNRAKEKREKEEKGAR